MIRNFELADLDEVMSIWLETNLLAHPFIDENFWKNNFDFVKMVLPNSQIKVFEEAGSIKGFIGMLDHYIAGLFILPSNQSKGIGKALLNTVKETQPVLHLDVYTANQQALAFYQKQGFHIVSEKENTDTGHPEYFMVWSK